MFRVCRHFNLDLWNLVTYQHPGSKRILQGIMNELPQTFFHDGSILLFDFRIKGFQFAQGDVFCKVRTMQGRTIIQVESFCTICAPSTYDTQLSYVIAHE